MYILSRLEYHALVIVASVAGESERSIVHDRLFVQINDSIRQLASECSRTKVWDFVCECPEVTCRATVRLTPTEFDERRAARPPVPVHAAAHDD